MRVRRAVPWFVAGTILIIMSCCLGSINIFGTGSGGSNPDGGAWNWNSGSSDWGSSDNGSSGWDSGSWDSGGSNSGSWDSGGSNSGSWDFGGSNSGSWDSGSNSGSW